MGTKMPLRPYSLPNLRYTTLDMASNRLANGDGPKTGLVLTLP